MFVHRLCIKIRQRSQQVAFTFVRTNLRVVKFVRRNLRVVKLERVCLRH